MEEKEGEREGTERIKGRKGTEGRENTPEINFW